MLWDMYRVSSLGFAANGLLMFALAAMFHDLTFHTFMLPWWLEACLLIVQSVLSYMADVVCEFEERRETSKWYRLDRICAIVLLSNSVGRMVFGAMPLFQRLISATGFIGVGFYFREIHFLMRRRLIPAMKYHTCWHFSMCATAMAFNLWSAGCQFLPRINGFLQPLGRSYGIGCLIGLDQSVIGSATNAEQRMQEFAATVNATVSSISTDHESVEGLGSASFRIALAGFVVAGFICDCAFPSDAAISAPSAPSAPASKDEYSPPTSPSAQLEHMEHVDAWCGCTGG
jgi:hypothetical protein